MALNEIIFGNLSVHRKQTKWLHAEKKEDAEATFGQEWERNAVFRGHWAHALKATSCFWDYRAQHAPFPQSVVLISV